MWPYFIKIFLSEKAIHLICLYMNSLFNTSQSTFMTWPGKTGLIYTKYMCLYYGTYLQFCVCYPHSVYFIEFLMDFCIYDDILDAIWITDKTLLHCKLSKSSQILRVDKTCFPRPGHIYTVWVVNFKDLKFCGLGS